MAVPIILRAECGLVPPVAALSPMTQPDGWVVHWVGGKCVQVPTLADSTSLWRHLQAEALDHIRGENYIDIEYNFAVDLAGRILEGRGFDYKSGANGSSNYNGHAWAVCILAGPGNTLTQAAIDSVKLLTQEGAQRKAAVSYVKGHRDVFPTACPGDEAYAHVGEWTRSLHEPVISPIDWAKIAKLVEWKKIVTETPLTIGQTRNAVLILKQLLEAHGYDVDAGPLYGAKVAAGVKAFKAKAGLVNRDGTICGGDCATALLTKEA